MSGFKAEGTGVGKEREKHGESKKAADWYRGL